MNRCLKCGRALSGDEIALHRKLIDRGAVSFLCLSCMAEEFGCAEETLQNKILQFRKDGCALFLQTRG